MITYRGVGGLDVPGGVGNIGWKTHDAQDDSYAYRNAQAPGGPSAARKISLHQKRGTKIKMLANPFSISWAPFDRIGVRVTMGSTRFCALFDASSIRMNSNATVTARGPTVPPSDCSDATLGDVPVCGDGRISGAESCEPTNDVACPGRCTDCTCDVCGNDVVEPSEACEATNDAACPGHCADCACEPYCGNDTIDPGEVCDGTAFDSSIFTCTSVFGPACLADCSSCCSISVCESDECCPGYVCAPKIGPGLHQCRKPCSMSGGVTGNPACDPGDVCMADVCITPHCTSDAQCAPAQCLGGACCMVLGGQLVCQ
jgi:hypothetical protein